MASSTKDSSSQADSGYFNSQDFVRRNPPPEKSEPPPFEPPDGGYGWVICFACFWLNLIQGGIAFSLGVMFNELVEFFDEAHATVALIGALLNGFILGVGPLASLLVDNYGCRATCILGSLVSATAFALSVLAPSVLVLVFTHGVLGGLGLGLVYMPALIACNYYFVKKRGLACSIGICGQGFGFATIPPLTNHILSAHGWQGAHLFFAGLCGLATLFGALLKPLQVLLVDQDADPPLAALSDRQMSVLSVHLSPPINSAQSKSSHCIRSFKNSSFVDIKAFDHNLYCATVRPLASEGIFYARSLNNLDLKPRKPSVAEEARSKMFRPPSCVLEVLKSSENPIEAAAAAPKSSFIKNPAYLTYCICNFACFLMISLPFTFGPDLMLKKQFCSEEQASYLIASIGLSNMVGQVAVGAFVDLPWVSASLVTGVSMLGSGLAVLMYPLCQNYGQVILTSVCFGLAVSGVVSLPSIVLVEIFGLDSLTSSMGLLVLVKGLSMSVGGPLAGSIYDQLQSYDWCFYMAGCLFGMSGLLFLCLFAASKFKKGSSENILLES